MPRYPIQGHVSRVKMMSIPPSPKIFRTSLKIESISLLVTILRVYLVFPDFPSNNVILQVRNSHLFAQIIKSFSHGPVIIKGTCSFSQLTPSYLQYTWTRLSPGFASDYRRYYTCSSFSLARFSSYSWVAVRLYSRQKPWL